MADSPIVCTLGPAALAARRENLLAELRRRAEHHQELENGLRLWFPAEEGILALIARAVDLERQCCRFLRFEITVEPEAGPIRLDLIGPPGTMEFLSTLLDS